MARQSAEARSAAAFISGATPPPPPKHLSVAAKVVWREMIASRPVDRFDAGSQILLEAYCEGAVHARALAKRLARLRKAAAWEDCKAYERRYSRMAMVMISLATKLRLSVQAVVDRRSHGLLERGTAPAENRDRLLGGDAVWGSDHDRKKAKAN